MPALPSILLDSLQNAPGFNRDAFAKVHAEAHKLTSVRLNPARLTPSQQEELLAAWAPITAAKVPWSQAGYYLSARPSFTFDPLFHAGAYYVQEASSMFLEHAVRSVCNLQEPLKVLDLCAAPGGKTTLLQSIISGDSLLIANETIRARAALLADNITRWGATNVVVSNNDPRDFARLEGYFDLMVVDAPCSGSGLFRRDPELVVEWSPENVALCCQRQQRILAEAIPALKENGVLIYSTCSYSQEEDEEIMQWLMSNFEVENLPLAIDPSWGIVTTKVDGAEGYRFYPDQVQGEGFFITCFRKKNGAEFYRKQKDVLARLPKKDVERLANWVTDADQYAYTDHQGTVLQLTPLLASELTILQKSLYIRKAGVALGQLTPKELIPDHQLALSVSVNKDLQAVELEPEQAIKYLRKEDVALNVAYKGWALMRFKGMNLGWAKLLPNRMNNYYPKELRILKATDGNRGNAGEEE
ncbi:RNA methyltransferase [Chitinophaga horti]|uniref:RNA methyltransferase n=1 Tax=Chitinophaga horti TaxID=2920382 RepID=A0ABY6J752_9BACT|nr:RNA methyltransferase [Chitinophaga horti]UYQ93984.1 RNA methyltransferase [Chitinophaga horti]